MVTVTDKGNYVEIDRGEPSRRFVVKPFDVKICGTEIIQFGDGLGNDWAFDIADLTGWTYSDIYDLKDQLYDLNNSYSVTTTITMGDLKLSLAPNKTVTNIAASTSEFVLQTTNSLRRELTIHNNSNGILYVLYGTGITTTNYSQKLNRQDTLHVDDFRGQINGLCQSATGFIMVTETFY